MMHVCKTQRDEGILVVTLDRPEKLNAMNQQMHRELEAIWDGFYTDPELRVAVLAGAGDRAFSVGSDLSAYETDEKPYALQNGYAGLTHRRGATKPIIAAVNGLALGGGFEVMLCCDLVVASENAEFGLPEPWVGLAALGGGIPRLCRKLPFNKAMELLLTGERMSAAEALAWGLASRVVPKGQAVDAAKALARRIIRGAPLSIQVTKQLADMTLDGADIADVLAVEDAAPKEMLMSSMDAQEGIRAFFEKRAPRWEGK
jgi:enoyl-CoA hydratase/carnithine racemase